MVVNATFNNISVISWRSALVVEEAEVPGENDPEQATGKLYHLRLRVECTKMALKHTKKIIQRNVGVVKYTLHSRERLVYHYQCVDNL
jgi:hypothetical protein